MSSTINDVTILCWNTPTKADRCAHAIATFLGAEPAFVNLNSESQVAEPSMRGIVPESTCLIAGAEALAQAGGVKTNLLRDLTDRAKYIFVYGFLPDDRHQAVLTQLSSGSLGGVHVVENGARFQFADGHRALSGPFSGLSVGSADPAIDSCFETRSESPNNTALIRVGAQPFLVQAEHDGSRLFFVACNQLADVEESVPRGRSLFSWFSRLVPLMIFLRAALGQRVWHNDSPRACFIIDDPLLKSRYGFLDYQQLAKKVGRRFAACIAFIPWNYRRSDRETARLFSAKGPGLHVCIHGCDHTRGEFASTDFESLCAKAQLALERMRNHAQRSDVAFDDVMVFPQGLFSVEALSALKAVGYMAAVNTDPVPVSSPPAVKLADLLEPAVTQIADFPLFGRHYPHDISEFALDLFLGKPVLAVEHHSYFRDGYEPLENFISQLNRLDDRIEWASLGEICSRANLTRTTAEGEIQVRFYTSRFSLTNVSARAQNYVLLPQVGIGQGLARVTCEGSECLCERVDGQVRIPILLASGQTAKIEMHPMNADTTVAPWRGTIVQNMGVMFRRLLCELRDNHVDTSRTLSAIVSGVRGLRRSASTEAVRPEECSKYTASAATTPCL